MPDRQKTDWDSALANALIVLCGLVYVAIYIFWLPAAQRQAQPGALESFVASPLARQIMNLTQVIAGPAVIVASLGIYKRLAHASKVARFASALGVTYGALMMLHGIYLSFLGVYLIHLANSDPNAVQFAKTISLLPSPFDPMGFSKYVLGGSWFVLTGALILRERTFASWIGGSGILAGVGLLLLFVLNGLGLDTSVLLLGMGGATIIAPLFWLGLSFSCIVPPQKIVIRITLPMGSALPDGSAIRVGITPPASFSFRGDCS